MRSLLFCLALSGTLAAQPLPGSIHISSPASSRGASGRVDAANTNVRAARATPVGRQVLKNGLRVLVNESPQEDIVAMELLVQVGAMEETTPVIGIEQILEELLRERISISADGTDRIEDCAASLKVTPELDYMRISLVSTSADFPGLLTAVAEAFKKRPLDEAELEKVRKKILPNLESPQGALSELYDIFRQQFYRYHPYKRSGRLAEGLLERLRAHQVQEFMDQYYVANRMIVSISGRIDRTEAVKMVEERFGALPQKEIRSLDVSWDPKPTEKEVFLTGGGQLGWLFVGYPAPSGPSRDYATMRVINALLGEGLSSRLFTEIREKRSLCYELGSMYPVLRGPAHFLTYTVTKPEQVWPARKQLLVEIERLKKDGISKLELEESKRKVIGSYWQERETNQGRAFQSAQGELLGLSYEFDSQFMHALDTITTEDVKEVARRYLDNATLIVARPRGIFYWDL
ncbi:insulinase family protein [bacterium]|nr:insulinase family protein [bacterium]